MTEAGDGPAGRCEICGREESDPRLLQQCFGCGVTFHLNLGSGEDRIDCGDAWVGEELGVYYHCQRCIDQLQAEALAQHTDPALARERQLLQTISGAELPGAAPPPAAPAPAPPSADQPPPRRSRSGPRRRYRRLDRP